jgi:hypothetical protein
MTPALTIEIRGGMLAEVYSSDPDIDLVVIDWDIAPDDPRAITTTLGDRTLAGYVQRPNLSPHDVRFSTSDAGLLLAAAEQAGQPDAELLPRVVRELSTREITTILQALRWWQETTDDLDGHHEPPTSEMPLPHADIDLLCQRLNCPG